LLVCCYALFSDFAVFKRHNADENVGSSDLFVTTTIKSLFDLWLMSLEAIHFAVNTCSSFNFCHLLFVIQASMRFKCCEC